jgi:CBS domain-containing protein
MARGDQTAHSDQDNAIILSDDYQPEKHQQYYQQLAKFVCDGLNDCGYIYCPGDVMAINPKWCQPLSIWKSYFNQWIEYPEPKALMLSSIFFDLKYLYGDSVLFSSLRVHTMEKSQRNSLFLSLMSENALHYQPPLGFFRSFVLEKGGGHGKALNMKKKGVVPIIDLARVYALNVGVQKINTKERLDIAHEKGAISEEGMRDLQDAYEFICSVRLQHQAKQIKQGLEADNYLLPDVLSSLERRHLKDAFEVVTVLQKVMHNNFLL